MTENDPMPIWQKFYQIISGINQHIIPEIIENVFQICENQLVNVLLDFKVYTKESFEGWKKVSKSMLISQDDEMCGFIHRLSRELDLDVNLTWSVICNFLIFDYYGKVDELKSIICYEANLKSLIDHLWMFYTSNRMFMLKSLRFMFEKVTDRDFIFYERFNKLLEAINLKKLWINVFKSFEYLITEIDSEKSNRVSSETLTKWVQRNNREQIEVLLLMIQILDLIDLNGEELHEVLKLFMRHGFGRHPLFFGAGSLSRPKDVDDIKNAEIGVFLTLTNRYWQNPGLFKMIPKDIESELEQYQIQGDNSTILFNWVVFKSSLSENHVDYWKNSLEALLKKKVFKTLADFILKDIYQNCKAGEIIVEGTHRLFIEFLKIVEEPRFIYEQEGFVQIICEIYKRPYLEGLENLGIFFEIALDMFPYMLDNFLDMVESVITCDENYTKTLRLLHNCPTYCTELPWPYTSDAFRSGEERNLFLGTDKFVIPVGTLTERCSCFGYDVIKFHYKFDFF